MVWEWALPVGGVAGTDEGVLVRTEPGVGTEGAEAVTGSLWLPDVGGPSTVRAPTGGCPAVDLLRGCGSVVGCPPGGLLAGTLLTEGVPVGCAGAGVTGWDV